MDGGQPGGPDRNRKSFLNAVASSCPHILSRNPYSCIIRFWFFIHLDFRHALLSRYVTRYSARVDTNKRLWSNVDALSVVLSRRRQKGRGSFQDSLCAMPHRWCRRAQQSRPKSPRVCSITHCKGARLTLLVFQVSSDVRLGRLRVFRTLLPM